MLIGLDFDNTIASYDSLFIEIGLQYGLVKEDWQGNKQDLKDLVFLLPDGHDTWMRIQGRVYGEFMHKAELMPGVANFLLHCKSRDIPVCIISHKTEYGHFDTKKISLRKEALKWMEKNNLFKDSFTTLSADTVFFEDTREKKVRKIFEIGCTHFIDDLEEVFQEPSFPKNTDKLLFSTNKQEKTNGYSTFDNWTDINKFLLGKQGSQLAKSSVKAIFNSSAESIISLDRTGNSQVYDVTLNKKRYAMKIYPDGLLDKRPRLKTEFKALNFLHKNLINNVPEPIIKNENLNIGFYSWIEGEEILDTSQRKIDECISFVEKIKSIKNKHSVNFTLASEACLSGEDLKKQINSRLSKLQNLSETELELNKFLVNTFSPLLEEVDQKFYKYWPSESVNKNLANEKMILSPSDFGLHNALQTKGNRMVFLDFDYFGWDDPVKLASDFYWHPAMDLSEELKSYWLKSMINLFKKKDILFEYRLKAALPLYAIRWVLIILNEFLYKDQKRRQHARSTEEYNWKEVKQFQLTKAFILCSSITEYIKNN